MLEKDDLPLGNGLKNGKGHGLHGSIEGVSDHLISISQFKQTMREILIEFLGLDAGLNPRNMYPTTKAFTMLGYDRAEQLRDAVASGLLRLGIEVEDRRRPSAKLPRYYFDIERCKKRLAQLPEKRWGAEGR